MAVQFQSFLPEESWHWFNVGFSPDVLLIITIRPYTFNCTCIFIRQAHIISFNEVELKYPDSVLKIGPHYKALAVCPVRMPDIAHGWGMG